MAFDAHQNFAYTTIATAPNPSGSGSFGVSPGTGALFQAPPFNATVWPNNSNPVASNAEIVRVTAIATDTFTVSRAQEGSTKQNIGVGWQLMAGITVKTITDIENTFSNLTPSNVGLGNVNNTSDATKQLAFLQAAYPVGSVYINASNSSNPASLLGFGTWVAIGAGRVLTGYNNGDSNFGTLGQTGGALSHFHWQTVGSDTSTGYVEVSGSGSGQTRVISTQRNTFSATGNTTASSREDGTYTASSLQPYIVVNMWQRTA